MTAPTVELRPAALSDLPAIVGLIRELAAYEKLEHLVQVTPDSLRPHLFGERPVVECVMADVIQHAERRVVGFALFFTNFSTFLGKPGLYLEDLYVQPAWRGHGVGKQLLQHLAGIAVDRGYGRFDWSVLDWNESAIQFYERLGAKVLPDWRICRVTETELPAFAGRG